LSLPQASHAMPAMHAILLTAGALGAAAIRPEKAIAVELPFPEGDEEDEREEEQAPETEYKLSPQEKEYRLQALRMGRSPSSLVSNRAGTALQPDEKEGVGLGMYHLTADGAKRCDFGVTVTETDCFQVGKDILKDMRLTPGRDYLVAGGFKNAPPGCSLHSKIDFAVTYNTDVGGENDGTFASICHGRKEEAHSVKVGENECDFGNPIPADKCLDSINQALDDLLPGSHKDQAILNVGHWSTLPPGCSMHIGAGGDTDHEEKGAWYNTQKDGTNDGSYVLVCTGTVVPQR